MISMPNRMPLSVFPELTPSLQGEIRKAHKTTLIFRSSMVIERDTAIGKAQISHSL